MEEESPRASNDLDIRVTDKGKSVFAKRIFQPGDFIIAFRGKRYSREEYLRKVNPKNNHFLQIDTHLFLGPTRTPDNYINHCCDPNTGLRIIDGKVLLFAIKTITVGEELSFDYSTTMAEDFWEMDCRCGSADCRGRIKDFKHLPQKTIERYLALGIVPDFVIRSLPAPAAAHRDYASMRPELLHAEDPSWNLTGRQGGETDATRQ